VKPLLDVYVYQDERYPDFGISESFADFRISMTQEELAEWKRVCAAYDKWQEKIQKLVNERIR
jgi:hypothetical protein